MSDTITATKVSNRALQRCGAALIADGALFTEDSTNAQTIRNCYDILRRSELRRNVWRFSIRRAPLRPVATTTKLYVPPAWAIGTTYAQAAIVLQNGTWWSSLVAANLANAPADDSTFWTRYFGPSYAQLDDTTTTYYAGELVYIASVAYLSLVSNNTTVPPGASWLTLTGTLAAFFITYPAGAGPVNESISKNLYLLPQGYMREAPQAPKSGSMSALGAPTGQSYSDWVFENNFFVTCNAGVIIFRFAADITNANEFDPMFVEGLGCRIALEVCEALTQSSTKLTKIEGAYKLIMGEARIVNGIETGPTEPPLDDYIACRA